MVHRALWWSGLLSIPSIWDLLLRVCPGHRGAGRGAAFQSPQSGICFCEGAGGCGRLCGLISFNPLNLGSASARAVRGRSRSRRWYLSIPSIWDLLLRGWTRGADTAGPDPFQSPQSGICFCERVRCRRGDDHGAFQSPQSGICFCEACGFVRPDQSPVLSIPSIWDLLLREQQGQGSQQQTGAFNPLNLGSASASIHHRPLFLRTM